MGSGNGYRLQGITTLNLEVTERLLMLWHLDTAWNVIHAFRKSVDGGVVAFG